MRILRKRIWTWWMSRKRLSEELALAQQLVRLRDEEISHLRRLLTLRVDQIDAESWTMRAAGAEAKTLVESLRRPG